MKKESTPEFDLYNCNEYIARGDIWRGSNYLSNLSDKKCKEELEKNVYSFSPKCLNSKRKYFVSITFHKIKTKNGARDREPKNYDGFFTLEININGSTKREYYTTFKRVIDFIEREKYCVQKITIISGYSRNGEHLKKGGGSNE